MMTDEEKEVSALALLYLSKQDLTNATPESLTEKYSDAFSSIQSALERTSLGNVRRLTKPKR